MEVTAKTPRRLILAAAIAGLFATAVMPAFADTETLLDKLHEKGVLTDEEYQEMRTEARAEKRAQALKEAQAGESKEKAREAFPTQTQGKFKEGFVWESGDKSSSVTIAGRVQADYRKFSGEGSSVTADTFDLRRAYLGVAGKMYDYVTWDITGDFAQTTPPPLDVAWINFAINPSVQLRFGQFKMPFSMEELTSSRFIDFQERSLLNQFVPQKERGFMVWGVPTPGLVYGVALSTGQGKNNNDTVPTKAKADLIGRVAVNVAEFIEQKNMVLHFAGAYSEGILPANFGLSDRTEGRGATFFNTANFAGDNVRRRREGLELALAWGPVKLQSELLRVNYSGAVPTQSYSRNLDANYVEALWLVTGEHYADAYKAGAFGRILPNSNFAMHGGGWGTFEVGLRLSHLDASDFKASNAAGTGVLAAQPGTPIPQLVTPTNMATGTSVGVKWIMNPNTRIYLNYVLTRFDTDITLKPNYNNQPSATISAEKAATLRVGIDF
jgi:phosphate-selective porin OprO/OprP